VICRCGHLENEHKNKRFIGDRYTHATKLCWHRDENSVLCFCDNFKLDNLRYLEELSK
jgi:hypothetical protein